MLPACGSVMVGRVATAISLKTSFGVVDENSRALTVSSVPGAGAGAIAVILKYATIDFITPPLGRENGIVKSVSGICGGDIKVTLPSILSLTSAEFPKPIAQVFVHLLQ